MKRLALFAVAVLATIVAATGVLKSHGLLHFGIRGMPSIQDLQTREKLDKLPVHDFEDRSLVFPRETSR